MKPFEIHKQVVNSPSRKLSVKWVTASPDYDERQNTPWELITISHKVESISGELITGEVYRRKIAWIVDKNRDEDKYEFASIFDVLSGKYDIVDPFSAFKVEEKLAKALSAAIADEIDNEIINSLILSPNNNQNNNNQTP